MPILVTFFTILVVHLMASGDELKSNQVTTATPKANSSRGPHCVDGAEQILKLVQSVRANAQTNFKYKAYQDLLSTDSEVETMARLIYAETLAANCPEKNSYVMPGIARVIAHRAQNKKSNLLKVIFKKNQFSSSLNIYDESRYKDFLCPKDQKLWQQSLSAAKNALDNESPKASRTTHYYLFRHSSRLKPPPWTQTDESPDQNDKAARDCVRFYVKKYP